MNIADHNKFSFQETTESVLYVRDNFIFGAEVLHNEETIFFSKRATQQTLWKRIIFSFLFSYSSCNIHLLNIPDFPFCCKYQPAF